VDVIVAAGTAAAQAAKQATSTVPIVMTAIASDPAGLGFIASLARPCGNIIGLASLEQVLSAKRIELRAGLVPGLSRVAVIVTADNPSKPQNVRDSQVAADCLGTQLQWSTLLSTISPRRLKRHADGRRGRFWSSATQCSRV
jgi:putative tryptophan/tyrosine transport system substrate-binding protein